MLETVQQAAVTERVSVKSVFPGKTGGAIFTGSNELGETVRVIASYDVLPDVPESGAVFDVTGEIKHHEQYGPQLHANRVIQCHPSGRVIVDFLARSELFPGLGEKRAEALWQAYGNALYEILAEGDIAALQEVIPGEVAERAVQGWAEEMHRIDVVRFLQEHNLPLRLSRKVIKAWPGHAVALIKADLYRLLAFLRWKEVDAAAMKIGIDEGDERRLLSAIEAALYRVYDKDGSTAASVDELYKDARLLAGTPLDRRVFDKLIVVGEVQRRWVMNQGLYQAIGPWRMEREVERRLHAMLSQGESYQFELLESGTDFGPDIECFEKKEGITLGVAQRKAVDVALCKPLAVITGGAGTGKTTVLKAIYSAIGLQHGVIHQMALSGRAAKRMEDATDLPAQTIAAFLLRARDDEDFLQGRPYVVIDEASMLDLPTFYRILAVLPEGARLLLVGDPFQLPPIGPGLVLHQLVKSKSVPTVMLEVVHRQQESSGIPAIAEAIRNAVWPELQTFTDDRGGVSFIDAPAHLINDVTVEVCEQLHAENAWDHSVQVVCAYKTGVAGVDAINTLLHNRVKDQPYVYNKYIKLGEPIIFKRNDWDRGLNNGSLGIVTSVVDDLDAVGPETVIAQAEFDTGLVDLTEADFEYVELAYAITCHKAQGSQSEKVVIPVRPLGQGGARFVDLSMIYTMLTRGVSQVVFVGDRAAAEKAVTGGARHDRRNVGLSV